MAGSALNLKPKFNFTDNFDDSLWAQVEWQRVSRESHPLAEAIPERVTDRRIYEKGSIRLPVFAKIQEVAARYPLVEFSLIETITPDLKQFLKKSESYLWNNSHALIDFLQWMRLDGAETYQTRDGLNYESVDLKKGDTYLFKLLRKYPRLIKLLWPIGIKPKINQMVEKQLGSSAGLYLLSVKEKSEEALIQVGEVGFEIWTLLNSKGLGVQPITVPSLSVYDLATENAPPSMSPAFRRFYQQGADCLKKAFDLEEGVTPVWTFRTGLAKELPLPMRTQRRPLRFGMIS